MVLSVAGKLAQILDGTGPFLGLFLAALLATVGPRTQP